MLQGAHARATTSWILWLQRARKRNTSGGMRTNRNRVASRTHERMCWDYRSMSLLLQSRRLQILRKWCWRWCTLFCKSTHSQAQAKWHMLGTFAISARRFRSLFPHCPRPRSSQKSQLHIFSKGLFNPGVVSTGRTRAKYMLSNGLWV